MSTVETRPEIVEQMVAAGARAAHRCLCRHASRRFDGMLGREETEDEAWDRRWSQAAEKVRAECAQTAEEVLRAAGSIR